MSFLIVLFMLHLWDRLLNMMVAAVLLLAQDAHVLQGRRCWLSPLCQTIRSSPPMDDRPDPQHPAQQWRPPPSTGALRSA